MWRLGATARDRLAAVCLRSWNRRSWSRGGSVELDPEVLADLVPGLALAPRLGDLGGLRALDVTPLRAGGLGGRLGGHGYLLVVARSAIFAANAEEHNHLLLVASQSCTINLHGFKPNRRS
jgi:hypothetical protein